MIKRISLVRRKPEMTHDEFVAHWMGPHAAIVRQLPGLRGLRFNVVNRWSPGTPGFDGIGEIWFDSEADAEKAFAAEPFKSQLVEDRKKFMGEGQWCFVEEHVAVKPPA